MNSLELTKWLMKVRDALAEHDEVRRNGMLRAADKFLKRSTQRSLALSRTRISGGGRALDKFAQPKQMVAPRVKN
jgi:hypothetical protein